ncbi:hypothetical protein L1987_81970 [Smallanthus sonchifolius]|uniref:Uncharacterized protein n=1 Tax=Smallanthus sonchifolius TaxID=185202 RepID=A0ACB8YR67_9ASTR|nr:hypothetical protein L1987_81970 [Smallanthus sonchifolius]
MDPSISISNSNSLNIVDFVVNKGHGVKGLAELGLKTLPHQYIQPPQERIDHTRIVDAHHDSIPLIDMSRCDDPNVAKAVCDAAQKCGFFRIVNHGVPIHVLEDVKDATHKFFGLPAEEKKKYSKEESVTNHVRYGTSFTPEAEKALEWKDYLSLFFVSDDEAASFWPPVCRNQALEYMRSSEIIIKKAAQDTHEWFEYVSTLTILLQDDIGGLYVRNTETMKWIHIAPVSGSLVINVGDALQIMSNGKYKSVEHHIATTNQLVTNMKCPDKERDALLHFKAHIKDPNDYLSSWTTNDCCNWLRVTCNERTGHVSKLDLGRYGFKGQISPSLLNLTYLNDLDLSGNSFNQTVPMFIGSMTRLTQLDLSSSLFIGTIPWSIGSLTKLTNLDLSSNSFSGTIPWSIGSLTKLTDLDLSSNSFVGTIPAFIGSMTQLRSLRLDSNSFDGDIPPALGNLTNLKRLSLRYLNDGCNLSQVKHPYSTSFVNSSSNSSSSIFSLSLGHNNLNSSMYHWLLPLTSNSLWQLILSDNMLDALPEYIGKLCSLATLSFSNNFAVGKFSDFLTKLSGCTSVGIQELDVSNNHFTDSLSSDIQKFPSLVYLNLANNHLNGTISEKVWGLDTLDILDISSNSLRGVISESIGKSKLHTIDLSNNFLEGVLGTSKSHMSNISYIKYIDLSFCKLGPSFPKWIQTLKNLTHLDISNTRVSDIVPDEFWNMWPSRLTYLNISSNNITGKIPDLLSNFDPDSLIIDLGHNKLSGRLRASILSSVELEVLGKQVFWKCACLDWGNLSGLYLLSLRSNNFFGHIPSQLCELENLQILDLSMNNLNGTIPSCINNLTSMVQEGFSQHVHSFLDPSSVFSETYQTKFPPLYADYAMIQWQGNTIEFNKNLGLLKSIDLSSNNLTRRIPYELTDLRELLALNLSNNALVGEIPHKIGEMKNLLTLDLSRNNLSGGLPSSMSQLNFINYIDMSHNNLSGRIPPGQLQTFDPSRYVDNAGCVGFPC